MEEPSKTKMPVRAQAQGHDAPFILSVCVGFFDSLAAAYVWHLTPELGDRARVRPSPLNMLREWGAVTRPRYPQERENWVNPGGSKTTCKYARAEVSPSVLFAKSNTSIAHPIDVRAAAPLCQCPAFLAPGAPPRKTYAMRAADRTRPSPIWIVLNCSPAKPEHALPVTTARAPQATGAETVNASKREGGREGEGSFRCVPRERHGRGRTAGYDRARARTPEA
ncbi:hypothetical protein BOTBODRAFT_638359 [Botryobasidium botryosum FD-172 SS1]|uniref:Uncharacterized protein n=1 Tax=Botryobasidium botryosum (strain FD-172 SS1) TaxID=930990 RepID=A0A067M8C8_BOTB1|nr:hypothetical protein BOTBODRAFT_638359 [Botryobasidium botryosum FD-172 SS1]